jgi:alginate O-acetyltransferase complex protein AlgI
MIFSSYEFIFLFLPICFSIYFFLNLNQKKKYATIFLVTSSLFFYGWWNIIYVPLIIISVITNYFFGYLINRSILSNFFWLICGVVFNILLLGYFKYSDFFIQNINLLFNGNYSLLNLTLPLAISFFTFQQIAYLADSYKGEVNEHSFLNYFAFVTFFPQLIAGPIVHHKEMMPQFFSIENKKINYKNLYLGIFIFSIGLFKKVVIADTFALWATNGFDTLDKLYLFEAWITSLSYTFQLYFDFSGYTDMAIGIALLFNIRLPFNFNSPYKALSIRDFWKRWHITLSRFLRDYIYIPLGGNKKGNSRLYSNLLITFLIGGIWHGAGWTFLIWGLLHALAIIIHRIWVSIGITLNKYLSWFLTFNFINLSWIFFRAENWNDAIKVLKGMMGFSGIMLPSFAENFKFLILFKKIEFGDIYWNFNSDSEIFLWIFMAFLICTLFKNSTQIINTQNKTNKKILFITFLFSISLMNFSKKMDFIYFNF